MNPVEISAQNTDCNGNSGGSAYVDSCGNCVGGNTGDVACIAFSPTVSISLSSTDCDSLTDLTINVSQDPNEPDMSTSLFASDLGSFDISNMVIGDVIGSAFMSANGGSITFNTSLIVSSIISSNQAIIQSQDINTGLVLGTFTITNLNPGVSISASSVADNNNVTSGNSETIILSNIFINPTAGSLLFTTTIDSELGDIDVQNFPFSIVCLCLPTTSTDIVVACDSYTWSDGITYTTSNNIATFILLNAGGCDSTVTLDLTINPSTTSTSTVTECDTYTWNGQPFSASGVYTYATTNANGCDSTATLNLIINPSTTSSTDVTECDTYSWNGQTYTTSGVYTFASTNAAGCDSIATLNLTINPSTTSSVSVTECDTYTWNGTAYTTSGVYTFASTNSNGCDSTATLNLTINNSSSALDSITICSGNSYNIGVNSYNISGTYIDTLTSFNGCDSVVTTVLYVQPSGSTSIGITPINSSICNGEAITIMAIQTYYSAYQWYNASTGIAIPGAIGTSITVSATGGYYVEATNSTGCSFNSVVASVTVLTVSAPTGLSSSAIQLDRATMNWSAVANAEHYDIRLREQGASTWTTLILNLYTTSKQKTGLSSSTDYEWQVRSACSNDSSSVSAWTATQSFTTLTPCTAPLNTTTTAIGLTDATLNWDAAGGAWGYIVRYKQVSQAWGSFTFDTVTTNSLALSSLSQGTAYHWQVKSMCNANGTNNSGFASLVTFNTGACNVSLTTSQTNIGCYGGSDGSIDLTVSGGSGSFSYLWSDGSISEDINSLTAGTYSVTVTDNNWGCIDSATFVITEPASAFSVSLQATGGGSVCSGSSVTLSMTTWASPNNTYQWNDASGVISGETSSTYTTSITGTYSLTVTTSAGCTATSSGLAITIISLNPPSGLSTSNIQIDAATMNWSAVTDADHYDIRMRVQGSSSWTIALNYLYGTSKEKFNLTSATTYDWEIRSVCSFDNSSVSAWSSTESFTTASPCTTPTNPDELNITTTTADLVWDAIPGSWGYRLMYLQNGAAWNTIVFDTINTNIDAISGLNPGITYKWRVKGLCDASGGNNSSWTGWQFFSTTSSNRITAGDVDLGINLNIFPNPTRGLFNISFVTEKVDNFEITIVDACGKLVSQDDKQDFIGEYTKQVDLSDSPRGIYMIQIRTQNSFVSKRIVLQ